MEWNEEPINRAISFLKENGTRVTFNRISPDTYTAGTPKDRLKQIKRFIDSSAPLAVSVLGGKNANQLLSTFPYTAYDMYKKSFLGFSDLTCLLLALNAKTQTTNYHYLDLAGGLGADPEWDLAQLNKIGTLHYENSLGDSDVYKHGNVEGKLVGGNLAAMSRLLGTEYMPDVLGAILFVEAYTSTIEEIDAYFGHLAYCGILDKIGGLIVGSFHNADKELKESNLHWTLPMKQWLPDWLPVIKTPLIGHKCRNILLPVGKTLVLNTRKNILYEKTS